jgi:hypothetical protein
MNGDYFNIPKEEPSIIFPVGAIIEDVKGKYKILQFEKQDLTHKYKVEVLQQKIPIPNHMKPFIDEKIQWIIVLPQNLSNIIRIE